MCFGHSNVVQLLGVSQHECIDGVQCNPEVVIVLYTYSGKRLHAA